MSRSLAAIVLSATVALVGLVHCSDADFTTAQDPTGPGGYGVCTPGEDSDLDGLPDEVEGCELDSDADTIPNYADTDSDGDGVADSIEGAEDGDGDGVPDYLDTDSDDDGVDDGDEDLNGDGKLGCCLSRCGEERADCPGVGPGKCGPGQQCVDGACQPPAAFLCSNGETDPTLPVTLPGTSGDRDLPTFICRKAGELEGKGLKEIDFNRSSTGDWTVALEKGTLYGEMVIDGAADKEVAAAFDYTGNDQVVAGLVASLPATSDDVNQLSLQLIDAIKGLVGAQQVATLSSGNRIESHDRFPTVVSTQLAITMGAPHRTGGVRNALLNALYGKNVSGGGTGYGPDFDQFLMRFQTQLRPDGRAIILGGVAPGPLVTDARVATNYLLEDISNGTGLATVADSDTVECDPFDVQGNPVADIIWVVDESGSMSDNLEDIVNNASDFFSRALKSGLDFRMGVAGVAEPDDGNPFMPPPTMGKFCGELEQGMLFPPMPDIGDRGPDRFLGPNEQDVFKSCVQNPPYDEGGSEYGLANAYEAVTRHLPRAAGDVTKIRPNATLVLIIATDEAPDELKSGGYAPPAPGAFEFTGDLDPQCNLPADKQQQVDAYLKPWLELYLGKDPRFGEQARAMVNLIGGLCNSGDCEPEMANGYRELVKATGGIAADVCQKNLGPTLQIIIDSISGAASLMVLEYVPISASLAVAVGDQQLPRNRVNGFDYVGFSNSLVFVGVPTMQGAQVVASYRRWVKQAVVN